MKSVTVNDVMSWEPCYIEDFGEDKARMMITDLFAGRETLTVIDMLRLDIPAQDRLWAVLREDCVDDRTLRLFACDCAERVLPLYEAEYPDDDRPRKAIETARRYADGQATEDELAAARAAARAADLVADLVAAGAAAGAADSAAEREWQVNHLIEMLEGEERE
jgi:hypothetical protein